MLSAATPGAGLPRLQSVLFGSAQMGFGDLFIAAALGALLAAELGNAARPRRENATGVGGGRPPRVRSTPLGAGLLTAGFALAFDLLFLAVPELPATVPVALTLIALELAGRRRRSARAAARRTGPRRPALEVRPPPS